MATKTDKIAEAQNLGKQQCGPETLAAFYDDWAKEGSYDQDVADAGYMGPEAVAYHLSEIIENKDARILDVGSGTGLVGEQLAKQGFTNVCAVDPSQESLSVSQVKGHYKDVIRSLVGPERLPFEDNSFAGAGSSGAFLTGHCDGTSLREVVRLVKPGGKIVIAIRRTFYEDDCTQGNFNFRAVSDELLENKLCTLEMKDIPNYAQKAMGVAMIYTVL